MRASSLWITGAVVGVWDEIIVTDFGGKISQYEKLQYQFTEVGVQASTSRAISTVIRSLGHERGDAHDVRYFNFEPGGANLERIR